MKLKEAVEIGICCGLSYVEECVENVYLHCLNLFSYDKIEVEFNELVEDYYKFNTPHLLTPIEYYISRMNLKKVFRNNEDKIYNCPRLERRNNE